MGAQTPGPDLPEIAGLDVGDVFLPAEVSDVESDHPGEDLRANADHVVLQHRTAVLHDVGAGLVQSQNQHLGVDL